MSKQRYSRRAMLKLMGATAASSLLAACTGVAPETGSQSDSQSAETDAAPEAAAAHVIMMYNGNEISDEELQAFDAENAPYSVERIDTDMVKFFSMLAAGQQIDCFRTFGINTSSMVTRRVPLDLTDYFATTTVVPVEDLLPANDLYLYQGRRYGMVKDWSPDYSIWINKALWEEAGVEVPDPTEPLSYQEWRDLSPKLTQQEGDRTLVFGTDFTPLNNPLVWMSTTNGGDTLFNDDFTSLQLLDNPANKEAATFWVEWGQEGGVPSVITPHVAGWSGEDFVTAAAAATQWGYWFSGMAESEQVPGENILMMRAPTWGPDYANPCSSGTGMMITSTTEIPDAAWRVFEWFGGQLPAENRAKSGWGVPGLRSMLELMPTGEPWRQHNRDMVEWEIENTSQAFAEWSPFITIDAFGAAWGKFEEAALLGEVPIDEMLASVEKEINEAIQEGMDRAGSS